MDRSPHDQVRSDCITHQGQSHCVGSVKSTTTCAKRNQGAVWVFKPLAHVVLHGRRRATLLRLGLALSYWRSTGNGRKAAMRLSCWGGSPTLRLGRLLVAPQAPVADVRAPIGIGNMHFPPARAPVSARNSASRHTCAPSSRSLPPQDLSGASHAAPEGSLPRCAAGLGSHVRTKRAASWVLESLQGHGPTPCAIGPAHTAVPLGGLTNERRT